MPDIEAIAFGFLIGIILLCVAIALFMLGAIAADDNFTPKQLTTLCEEHELTYALDAKGNPRCFK